MATQNRRNGESRASWLHLLTPFMGKYVVLGDITSTLDVSSSTVTQNILDLIKRGLITQKKFGVRRFIEITPKGEKLRDKYDAPPPPPNPLSRVIEQPKVNIVDDLQPLKSESSPYQDLHYNELKYINMFVTGTLNFLEDFEPGLGATSMQLRSASNMFRRALELDQQQIELIMNDKRHQAQKKKIKVRDY